MHAHTEQIALLLSCAGSGEGEKKSKTQKNCFRGDCWQYSNMYQATGGYRSLVNSASLRRQCVQYVTNGAEIAEEDLDMSLERTWSGAHFLCFLGIEMASARWNECVCPLWWCFALACSILFFSQLRPGVRVRDLVDKCLGREHRQIDERRLITFGVLKNIIVRVHEYPLLKNPHSQSKAVQRLSALGILRCSPPCGFCCCSPLSCPVCVRRHSLSLWKASILGSVEGGF